VAAPAAAGAKFHGRRLVVPWKRTSGDSAANWAHRTYRSSVGVPAKPPASCDQNGTPDSPWDSPPRNVLAIAW
jgi:hypothetical protein